MLLRYVVSRRFGVHAELSDRQSRSPHGFTAILLVFPYSLYLVATSAVHGLSYDVFKLVLLVTHQRIHDGVATRGDHFLGNWYQPPSQQRRELVKVYVIRMVIPKELYR